MLEKFFVDLVNYKNEEGDTPLHSAIRKNYIAIVKFLLANKADPNALNTSGNTPLFLAVINENVEAASLLCQHGANPDIANYKNVTPLHLAVGNGNGKIVRVLCQNGANLNITLNGFSLLRIATFQEYTEIINILCEYHADIHQISSDDSRTILHHAVLQKVGAETIKMLHKHGANFNAVDKGGRSPLLIAILNEHVEIIKVLCECGTDINAPDQDGKTPLHWAVKLGNKDIVSAVLKCGAFINSVDKDGDSPLHDAVFYQQEEIIDLLCQSGADINLGNKDGLTPVHFAFYQKTKTTKDTTQTALLIVERIRKYGAEIKDESLKEKLAEANSGSSKSLESIRVKERKRQNKNRILSNKPFIVIDSTKSDKPTPVAAIGGETYCEEFDVNRYSQLRELFIHRLEECSNYKIAPITAPFFAVLALAAIGRHDKNLESVDLMLKKHLKILLINASHVGDFVSSMKNYFTTGVYSHQNTLFIALGVNKEISKIIGEMFHESAHFVADEVMKNGSEPYLAEDSSFKNQYQEIIKEVEMYLSNATFTSDVPEFQYTIKNFKSVFSHYTQEKHGLELFVQVLETIGTLGYQRGTEWLKKHFPNLFEFYLTYFNPACMQYLKNHNVEQFLQLDESFSIALDTMEIKPNSEIVLKSHITPFHNAVLAGKLQTVEAFCKKGMNVNTVIRNGITPLLRAILENNLDMVHILCKGGAEVELASPDERISPLMIAVNEGNLEIVRVLLTYKADVNAIDKNGSTALHRAKNIEIVRVLLVHKAEVNAIDKQGCTALHIAVSNGHTKIVNLLCESGANTNATAENSCTPLHIAADQGHVEIMKDLLAHNANVNAVFSYSKRTALHVAVENKHKDCVDILLAHKADVYAIMGGCGTVLHLAARKGDMELAKMLLENYPDLFKTVSYIGETALHVAAEKGKIQMVNLLLSRHPELLQMLTFNNETALHFASEAGHFEIVNILLANQINIHAVTKNNQTALHFAAKRGHADIIEVLWKKGANIHVIDNQNNTPLQVATEAGRIESVKILCQMGAVVNVINENGATLLHFTAAYGPTEIATPLYKHGANINASTTKDNFTPLHCAAAYGRTNMVNFLCQYGADINSVTEDGKTAFQMAQENGHTMTVEALFLHQLSISSAYKSLMTELEDIKNQKGSFFQDLGKNEAKKKALEMLQEKITAKNDSVVNILIFAKEKKSIISQSTLITSVFFKDDPNIILPINILIEQLENFVQKQRQNHLPSIS